MKLTFASSAHGTLMQVTQIYSQTLKQTVPVAIVADDDGTVKVILIDDHAAFLGIQNVGDRVDYDSTEVSTSRRN